MVRTSLFFKVEIEHEKTEDPEKLSEEVARQLLGAPEPPPVVPQKPADRKCPCCGIGTLCFLGWVPAGTHIQLPVPVHVWVDSS